MRKLLIAILLTITINNIYSQDVVDKIVAVVDNEIILKSELDFQINLLASQKKINPDNPQARVQVLNALIEDKLVYAQALLDSITATEDEMNRQIEYQINVLMQQYGSKERIEQIYGMTIEKIKRELRENVKKEILTQKLQEKKFGNVESSRREVEEFFTRFKDSLGVIPEKVKISHIFKNPKTSPQLKEKYRSFALALLDSLKNGVDFSDLAKRYSEDPGSAAQGGDLGYVKRGVFFPEFESAAFALVVNQISGVVESPVGFHIIQLLDRRGESVHTRHILIKIKADDEADLSAIEFLNEVRDTAVRSLSSFYDLARKYSDDQETSVFGGSLGTFYLEQLDKNLLDIVSKLKEGEISFPKRVDYSTATYGYHIVWLEKRLSQHLPGLDIDYTDLKKLSDEYKKQKLYTAWIEELRGKIFWEIKI